MKSFQEQYIKILVNILQKPHKEEDSRVGITRSVFGQQMRIDLTKEFPLMDLKDVSFDNVLHELLWFISGDQNVKYLIDNKCNIWNKDAYRFYTERINNPMEYKHWLNTMKLDPTTPEIIDQQNTCGYMGKIYGYQWRNFNGKTDQLQDVINKLNNDPTNRRMIITAHNPFDLETGDVALPSCHNYIQFYTQPMTFEQRINWVITNMDDTERENVAKELSISKDILDKTIKLDGAASVKQFVGTEAYNGFEETMKNLLKEMNVPERYVSIFFNMRSWDYFLGGPYNVASYAILLEIIGKLTNMAPYQMIANGIDVHLYEEHYDAAKELIQRYNDKVMSNMGLMGGPNPLYCSGNLDIINNRDNIDDFVFDDFKVTNYDAMDRIKAELKA